MDQEAPEAAEKLIELNGMISNTILPAAVAVAAVAAVVLLLPESEEALPVVAGPT